MADATETPKVITEHAEANEAIGVLRDIAKALKMCGDETVNLRSENNQLVRELDEVRHELSETEDAKAVLDGWREVIADYGRGILDRAELFDRTIGEML